MKPHGDDFSQHLSENIFNKRDLGCGVLQGLIRNPPLFTQYANEMNIRNHKRAGDILIF